VHLCACSFSPNHSLPPRISELKEFVSVRIEDDDSVDPVLLILPQYGSGRGEVSLSLTGSVVTRSAFQICRWYRANPANPSTRCGIPLPGIHLARKFYSRLLGRSCQGFTVELISTVNTGTELQCGGCMKRDLAPSFFLYGLTTRIRRQTGKAVNVNGISGLRFGKPFKRIALPELEEREYRIVQDSIRGRTVRRWRVSRRPQTKSVSSAENTRRVPLTRLSYCI